MPGIPEGFSMAIEPEPLAEPPPFKGGSHKIAPLFGYRGDRIYDFQSDRAACIDFTYIDVFQRTGNGTGYISTCIAFGSNGITAPVHGRYLYILDDNADIGFHGFIFSAGVLLY